VTVDGSKLVFKIDGEYETDLEIKYQTKTTTPTGAATFDNVAVFDDQNDNHAEANASIDREAPPVKTPIEMTKTATWVDPADKTKLNWQLQVTANDNQLINPVITDQLSTNQTYVADSAKLVDATGQNIPVTVSVAGNQVTFTIKGTLTSDLTLTYQTTTNEPTGEATFDNVAVFTDDNDNQAEADTSIDREAPPEEPEKVPIQMAKTAAWVDPADKTKINWQLQVTTNKNLLVNPVITDLLTGEQTYVADSVKAVAADGTVIPVMATVTGNELKFSFTGQYGSDFTLTYQTTTNSPTGAANYANVAVLDDDNNNHADANSSIDREAPPVEPAK